MKQLVLTAHAQVRLQERRLDPKWVESTARTPDWTEPEPGDDALERRFRAIPQGDGRILRVVCTETDTTIKVIIAMLDRDARRKL